MPERWKIWAMFVMSAPCSRVCSAFGHPGDGEVGLPVRQHLLRHDVDAALQDLDVQAVLVVEPLVDRRQVAGELRLDEPLQLQRHIVDGLALGGVTAGSSRGAARRFGGRGVGALLRRSGRGAARVGGGRRGR